MFAFICEEQGPDDEGVVGIPYDGNQILPLVGADMERVESLKPIAQFVADKLGKNIKIVVFSKREEIGQIEPSHFISPIKGEAVTEEEGKCNLQLTIYEGGVLMGVIGTLDEHRREALKEVFAQLLKIRTAIRERDGVKERDLGNGMIELTDKDGLKIIRPKDPWG
jgi:hypothetical protein